MSDAKYYFEIFCIFMCEMSFCIYNHTYSMCVYTCTAKGPEAKLTATDTSEGSSLSWSWRCFMFFSFCCLVFLVQTCRFWNDCSNVLYYHFKKSNNLDHENSSLKDHRRRKKRLLFNIFCHGEYIQIFLFKGRMWSENKFKFHISLKCINKLKTHISF